MKKLPALQFKLISKWELKRGVSPSSKEIFPFPSEGKGIKGIG